MHISWINVSIEGENSRYDHMKSLKQSPSRDFTICDCNFWLSWLQKKRWFWVRGSYWLHKFVSLKTSNSWILKRRKCLFSFERCIFPAELKTNTNNDYCPFQDFDIYTFDMTKEMICKFSIVNYPFLDVLIIHF